VRHSHLLNAIMADFAALGQAPSPALANPAPAPVAATAHPPAAEAGPCILLAEDNEINQIVTREILTRSGWRCDIVGNGRKAVEAAQSGRYDLILMDCQMPVLDGFDATREIRLLERAGHIHRAGHRRLPIVALTANGMTGDRERCLEAGMDAYTSKPIDPALLLSTINRFFTECPDAAEAA